VTERTQRTIEEAALAARHMGVIPDADAVGRAGTPGHGPYLVVHLKMAGDVIADARCQTYGCPAAIACGSELADWLQGRTAEEAARLTESDVRHWFRNFPAGKWHCARIAVAAAHSAVRSLGPPETRRSNEMSSRKNVQGALAVAEEKSSVPVPVPVRVRSSSPQNRWVTGPQKTLEAMRARSCEIAGQIAALTDEKARVDEVISALEAGPQR